MIPSIDTYLQQEIKSKLEIILSNRYIIEEILNGIQPEVANNFINSYTGTNPTKEIPIVYSLPQDKTTQQGAIYIGLRDGEESFPSMGNIEGMYDFKEGDQLSESLTIKANADNTLCYFQTSQQIGELINILGIQFASSDNLAISGNQIQFTYADYLVGQTFTVIYVSSNGAGIGYKKGFTATEHYSVLAVSTNMDTVRCLDSIIKAILILMRDNPQDHRNNLLQRIHFGQIEEINTGKGAEGNPEILYGRETIVSYVVSYSLEAPITDAILTAINVKMKTE
jgi:hypothetical protein